MNRMRHPKFLSNVELVNEAKELRNPCLSEEETFRRNEVFNELLERLEERWKNLQKKN